MNTKQGFSTLLTVLITAAVVGVLSGLITYSSVVSKKDLEIEDLKEELSQVKEKAAVEPGNMNLDTSETDNQQPTSDNQQQTTQTPSTATTDETANWKTYTNDKYGFSFKYPEEWEVSDSNNIISISTTKDQLTYSLLISIDGNPKNLTLDQYVDQAIQTLKEGESQDGPQIRYEKRENVQIDMIKAIKLKNFSGLGTVLDQYYISRGDKILKIMIHYQASEPILLDPEKNSKIANQILSTFQFTR